MSNNNLDIFINWARDDHFFLKIQSGDNTRRTTFNNWNSQDIKPLIMGGFAIKYLLTHPLRNISLNQIMGNFPNKINYITNTHDIDMECFVSTRAQAVEASRRMLDGVNRFCELHFPLGTTTNRNNMSQHSHTKIWNGQNGKRLIFIQHNYNNGYIFNNLRNKNMVSIVQFTLQQNGREILQLECGFFLTRGNVRNNVSLNANNETPSIDKYFSTYYGIPIKKTDSILEEQLSTLIREHLPRFQTHGRRNPFIGREPEKGKKTAFRVYALCTYLQLLINKGAQIPNSNRFVSMCEFGKQVCLTIVDQTRNNQRKSTNTTRNLQLLLRNVNLQRLFGKNTVLNL